MDSEQAQPTTAVPLDTTDRINAVLLPTFALVAILMTYLPFKSFYRNRNFPAANIVFLITLINIITFINALIWPNGDIPSWWNGVGLCDIETFIRLPLTIGVACSIAAFTRTLSNAIDVDKHSFIDTPALRRRALIVDILICWTIPVLQIALHYVVQVVRYGITPVYGCAVMIDNSWVAMVIMHIWIPILSLYSAYNACVIIYRLRKHKANLSRILSTGNSGYTARRYVKLFLIALFVIVVMLPIQFFFMSRNIPKEFVPYSWSRVHDPAVWPSIIYYPNSRVPGLEYTGWLGVSVSFQIFAFFGFNDEAIDTYRKWFVALGFAKIWPSLRESRATRAMRRRGIAGETRSSWRSHMDMVSKVVKYLEGSQKHSQSTTTATSECGQSRKNSQATASSVGLGKVSSLTANNHFDDEPIRNSGIENGISRHINSASPLPAIKEMNAIHETTQSSTTQENSSKPWFAHFRVPFLTITTRKARLVDPVNDPGMSAPQLYTSDSGRDIEAQPTYPPRKSSLIPPILTPSNGIILSTSIWSDDGPSSTSSDGITAKTTTQIKSEPKQSDCSSISGEEILTGGNGNS